MLQLPRMVNTEENDAHYGKNLIHMAVYIQSHLILEELVEFYRQKAIDIYKQDTSKSMKDLKRKVKKEIQDWMNRQTICDQGNNSIHLACMHGDSMVIRLLVKYGAELNVVNKNGHTPMHISAFYDKSYPLTFLQKRGLDVDGLDKYG